MARAAGGRIRTESMIDRLGKKPISEGFDLWDKDYTLGALRLLQCKLDAQTPGTPPFEVASALDAVGEIMAGLDEGEDALDHFKQAVDKYTLIQKKVLAELMACKAEEQAEGGGAQKALERVDKWLQVFDERVAKGSSDIAGEEARNQEAALGRMYFYRAQLLAGMQKSAEALCAAATAITLGCERVHLCHHLKGTLLLEGKPDEAAAAFRDAISARSGYFPAWESLVQLLKDQGKMDESLEAIDQAMKLHPQATLIREKAFLLSEKGDDATALDLLDKAIEQPPHEETETLGRDCESEATLYKAKAAILADLKRFKEAQEALDEALKCDPDDGEAATMKKDVAEAS